VGASPPQLNLTTDRTKTQGISLYGANLFVWRSGG
jgi:hypothetical protein